MFLFSEICYLASLNNPSDDRYWYLLEALKENKPADEIKKLSEDLQQPMYSISQKAYEQVQKETEAGQASGTAQDNTASEDKKDDDVIDAEYTKE